MKTSSQPDLSFPDLVASHTGFLRRMMFRLTQDEELAADLTQDALINALRFEDKFDGRNLKGWLVTLGRNLFMTHHKLRKPWANPLDATDLVYDIDCLSAHDTNTVFADLTAQELHHAIDMLPPKQATAQRLRLSGMSYEEIAEQENVPVGTVRTRLHHAKLSLPDLLRKMSPLTNYDMKNQHVERSVRSADKWQNLITYLDGRLTLGYSAHITPAMISDASGFTTGHCSNVLKLLTAQGYLTRQKGNLFTRTDKWSTLSMNDLSTSVSNLHNKRSNSAEKADKLKSVMDSHIVGWSDNPAHVNYNPALETPPDNVVGENDLKHGNVWNGSEYITSPNDRQPMSVFDTGGGPILGGELPDVSHMDVPGWLSQVFNNEGYADFVREQTKKAFEKVGEQMSTPKQTATPALKLGFHHHREGLVFFDTDEEALREALAYQKETKCEELTLIRFAGELRATVEVTIF